AVASTSRQVGLTLGVAVLGAVATAGIHGSLHHQLATASRPAWWLIAALGAAIVAIGLAGRPPGGRGGRPPPPGPAAPPTCRRPPPGALRDGRPPGRDRGAWRWPRPPA